MPFINRFVFAIVLACTAIAATIATTAHAQSYTVRGVSIFERVSVGAVDVTPITVLFEDRCSNPQLCFRSNRLLISAVLHTRYGLREVLLELGKPAQVPGGLLVLTSAGTPGSRNGAISIEKYQLELVYIPAAKAQQRRD